MNIPSKEVEEEAETKEETKCVLREYCIATHANLIYSAFFTDQRRTHGVRVDACLGPPYRTRHTIPHLSMPNLRDYHSAKRVAVNQKFSNRPAKRQVKNLEMAPWRHWQERK